MPFDALSVSSLPINLAALAGLAALAAVDLRTHRVPQILTLPVLAALGAWRVWRGDWIVVAYWLAAFSLYVFHVCNAGDVKVLMIELALWPSVGFVAVAGVTVAVVGTAVSLARCGGVRPFLRSLQVATARLLAGRLPSEAELRFYGSPQVFLYAAGAAVYLALLHAVGCVARGPYGG